MRSPEEMRIIEIDITNACIHNCSNCTRMCGHHKKPYFMTWDTFKRAVDSMEGFEGGVGVMGGEPTLHPEFERFATYLNSKYSQPKKDNYFIEPTAHFMRDRKLEERNLMTTYYEKNGIGQRIKGPVLFSSVASNYYKYYEIIQDYFRFQGINDHIIPCYHQPVMVSRKDLNIPDKQWETLRDKCWVQNKWSASITPKGCFFCEIAGTLDMLFDGPGGWPIERDWWKRTPEQFGEQLKWCELCGLALDTPSRNANEEIDDVSESLYRLLEEIKSPKLQKKQVHVITKEELADNDGQVRRFEYHDNNFNRLNEKNKLIYPKGFCAILVCTEEDTYETISECIYTNIAQVEKMIVFAEADIIERLKETTSAENVFLLSKERWGVNINRAHKITGDASYNLLLTSGVVLKDEFVSTLKKYVINPGTFHYMDSERAQSEKCSLLAFKDTGRPEHFVLYNSYALALRKVGFDGISWCASTDEFSQFWEEKKKVAFNDALLEGRSAVNSMEYEKGCRYVVYGTGRYGKSAFESICNIGSEVVFFCDTDINKQTEYMGKKVYSPDMLGVYRETYDKVVIAADAYRDIRNTILQNGLTDQEIIAPIF